MPTILGFPRAFTVGQLKVALPQRPGTWLKHDWQTDSTARWRDGWYRPACVGLDSRG